MSDTSIIEQIMAAKKAVDNAVGGEPRWVHMRVDMFAALWKCSIEDATRRLEEDDRARPLELQTGPTDGWWEYRS